MKQGEPQGVQKNAVRGGSWNNNAQNARSAQRNQNPRDNRDNNLGFRFALSSRVGAGVWNHGQSTSALDQTGVLRRAQWAYRRKLQGPRGVGRQQPNTLRVAACCASNPGLLNLSC